MTDNQAQSSPQDHFVEQGGQKIRWAELHQGLLQRLRKQFSEAQPFAGLTVGICLHVEPKTAVLCAVLLAGGGGNPIETMDLGLALQAQSLAYLAANYKDLPVGPQPVPGEINATIARWMVENLSRRGSASITL